MAFNTPDEVGAAFNLVGQASQGGIVRGVCKASVVTRGYKIKHDTCHTLSGRVEGFRGSLERPTRDARCLAAVLRE